MPDGRKHDRSYQNLNPGPVNIYFSKVLYQIELYDSYTFKLNL